MSASYEDISIYCDLGVQSKHNEYELTIPATFVDGPTTPKGGPVTSIGGPTVPATASVKKQKKISWLLCLTVGCAINFILLMLTVSFLAYYLSNYMATKSEVSRTIRKLQMLENISELNGSFVPPKG